MGTSPDLWAPAIQYVRSIDIAIEIERKFKMKKENPFLMFQIDFYTDKTDNFCDEFGESLHDCVEICEIKLRESIMACFGKPCRIVSPPFVKQEHRTDEIFVWSHPRLPPGGNGIGTTLFIDVWNYRKISSRTFAEFWQRINKNINDFCELSTKIYDLSFAAYCEEEDYIADSPMRIR